MATWGEIKLAALKKMDPSVKNLTMQRATEDYLNSIIPAANRGLQDLATAGRFIVKEYNIMTADIKGTLTNSDEIIQHLSESITYESLNGKAFYFEISGSGIVNIYIGEELSKTIEHTAQAGFTVYKGKLVNQENKPVKIEFTGASPYQFRNVAIYNEEFRTDEEVWNYNTHCRYKLRELVPDFFRVVSDDIVLEAVSDRYTKYKDYEWEGDDTLVIDATRQGVYKVHYYAYPHEITEDTLDTDELPLDKDVATILPVFIAAELYEDDDASQAYYFRQQYDVMKTALIPTGAKTKVEFEDVWGWS